MLTGFLLSVLILADQVPAAAPATPASIEGILMGYGVPATAAAASGWIIKLLAGFMKESRDAQRELIDHITTQAKDLAVANTASANAAAAAAAAVQGVMTEARALIASLKDTIRDSGRAAA